jgi:hypothetical protein
MTTTDVAPTETHDLALRGVVEMYDGMGPMFLREVLADATEGDVKFSITRIMPLGLHVRATRGDDAVDVVMAERPLIEELCRLAHARLDQRRDARRVENLWLALLDSSEAGRWQGNYTRRNALFEAFVMVTGEDPEAARERLDEAMIARHEQSISAEG